MASKTEHVLLRDGSAHRGGPRPAPPERPAKPLREADAAGAFAERCYSDSMNYSGLSVAGIREERAAFEATHGNPSPRQLAQAGHDPGEGTHSEPGDTVDQRIILG